MRFIGACPLCVAANNDYRAAELARLSIRRCRMQDHVIVRRIDAKLHRYPDSYFNGAIAVTSISISMPGQANWLIFSSV
jgi:hypothetical protein